MNVGDAVKQLPANVSNNSPNTTGNANFFAGSTIANLRGLNPFFGSRTLNLVNGRRFVPTNQGDGVDLNFIPSVLIDRVDVVTGGASAAYGSGAISGVNNVFLNRRLNGGKLDVDYGQTSESDGKDRHVGAAFGTAFAGDRGHVVFGVEWQESDAVGCVTARDWCARGVGFRQNELAPGFFDPITPQSAPAYTYGTNLRQNQISASGVFLNPSFGVTSTSQSNAAGTAAIPFAVGFGANTAAANTVVGGDGPSIYEYTNLRAPVNRKIATATGTFAITDSINASVDLSYGDVETTNRTGAFNQSNNIIAADNAFLTTSLRAAQVAAANQAAIFSFPAPPAGGAFFNKDWTSQVDSFSRFTTEVKRGAVGLDGRFGSSSWTWDGYYQYGKTTRQQLVNDNVHLNALQLALDSVVDNRAGSATLGQAVCRVTRDGVPAGALYDPRIAQGCVPINPFGTGALSPAAKAYSFGFLQEDLNLEQHVLALNTTGDLFAGFGAGAIKVAVGAEYRTEDGENIGSQNGAPDYARTDYLIQYGESFAGKVDVVEGYVETNIPVLRGVTGAQRLEFDLAARESHYKNKGGFGTSGQSRTNDLTTWKISGIWDPVEWLRVRASQSRDARAANFRELYYGQQIKAGGSFGFCNFNTFPASDPCNWSLEGNTALSPEKADTSTVGIVFSGGDMVPGFQFAADYFRIEIKDAIQQADVFRVINGCQQANIAEFCALITPDTPGNFNSINLVRALAFNGSGYEYRGIDFSATQRFELGDATSLNLRLLATRMIDQRFQSTPGGPFTNVVGQTGTSNSFLSDNQPTAKWLGNLSGTVLRGPASLTAQVRYISDGVQNYNGISPGEAGYGTAATAALIRQSTNEVASYFVSGSTAPTGSPTSAS